MLFKEIIAVYAENHTKNINTKCSVSYYENIWYIWLPLGLKVLIFSPWGQLCCRRCTKTEKNAYNDIYVGLTLRGIHGTQVGIVVTLSCLGSQILVCGTGYII
jgi:hypothetical protein